MVTPSGACQLHTPATHVYFECLSQAWVASPRQAGEIQVGDSVTVIYSRRGKTTQHKGEQATRTVSLFLRHLGITAEDCRILTQLALFALGSTTLIAVAAWSVHYDNSHTSARLEL